MWILVRSGVENGFPPSRRTHRRQRMSRGRRGRERRTHALFEAHAPDLRDAGNRVSLAPADDASFTWSSDPCTSIATATPSEQSAEVARSNRYRGRENLVKARRNRHRGRGERTVRGSPPVTASARERAWLVKKRKGVTALVPARIVRAPGSVPVRRSSCRSRQATSGPKYTRQTRTKKCGQGRANGGLGRGERRRSHVGERVERKDESHLGSSRTTTARDREKAQGDVRASSSGRNIAKSGAAVAGPGL